MFSFTYEVSIDPYHDGKGQDDFPFNFPVWDPKSPILTWVVTVVKDFVEPTLTHYGVGTVP